MIFAAYYLLGAIFGFVLGYVVRSVRAIRQMDQVQDALDKLVVAWANHDSLRSRSVVSALRDLDALHLWVKHTGSERTH